VCVRNVRKAAFALVAAAVGGLVVGRRVVARRAEHDLWAEATDLVDRR
jgi:hypothetical protein